MGSCPRPHMRISGVSSTASRPPVSKLKTSHWPPRRPGVAVKTNSAMPDSAAGSSAVGVSSANETSAGGASSPSVAAGSWNSATGSDSVVVSKLLADSFGSFAATCSGPSPWLPRSSSNQSPIRLSVTSSTASDAVNPPPSSPPPASSKSARKSSEKSPSASASLSGRSSSDCELIGSSTRQLAAI